MIRSALTSSLCLLASQTLLATPSLNPIPQESGFSGSIGLGANYSSLSSSMYKGNRDHGSQISNLSSPSSVSETTPVPLVDLRYTLTNSRTQFVLGSQVQDLLRMDSTLQLGVRQELEHKGIVAASLISGGQLNSNTWADPYATNTDRSASKSKSQGFMLSWENIMDSPWSAELQRRKISLDNEQSGVNETSLSASERSALDRKGNNTRMRISYQLQLGQGQFLLPSIVVSQDSLNGQAMSNKAMGIKLDYVYQTGSNLITANAYMGQRKYDQGNPLFSYKKADSTEYLLGLSYLRNQLLGYKPLTGFVQLAYGQAHADIDFYNITLKSVTTGLAYRF